MKILIAPDKFKSSLTALEVCEAIANGLKSQNDDLNIEFHPMADGGDDSLTIISNHIELNEEFVDAYDPLGRTIKAKYFTSNDAAFIEVASASGLVLLSSYDKNPMLTSTKGTGKLMVDAISKGFKNIYLFLGGSATNDAGMGIAHSLGFKMFDSESNELKPIGKNLNHIATIKNENLFDFDKLNINLFYDVANPMYGQNGAAFVYAKQKGASLNEIEHLNIGLENISNVFIQQFGIDVSEIPGGGAAGAIGAGLVALCNAKIENGFNLIADLTNLSDKIKKADWVISGEGRLDEQSLQGKVVSGVDKLCKYHNKKLSLFIGKNELSNNSLEELSVDNVYDIYGSAQNFNDAMLNGKKYLSELAKEFYDLRLKQLIC